MKVSENQNTKCRTSENQFSINHILQDFPLYTKPNAVTKTYDTKGFDT